jgi:hypothetical protein
MTFPDPNLMCRQPQAVLTKSYLALRGCLLEDRFTSFDIFDGLNSRFSTLLSMDKQFLRQGLIQIVRRFPINIRPLLGIRPSRNVKTLADFVTAELQRSSKGKFSTDFDESAIQHVIEQILDDRCPGYAGSSWGLPYPYATRSGWMREGTPNIIMTSYCANALLDFYEFSGDRTSYEAALGAVDFVLHVLGYVEQEDGTLCFNYIPDQVYSIHNANMLAVSFLARVARHTGEERLRTLAMRGATYTAVRQREDGAWYYGEKSNLHWIDGFHTGYILDSLFAVDAHLGEGKFRHVIAKGVDFLIDNFLLSDGRVKYYHNCLYPLDMQNIAQVCQTLCTLRAVDERAAGFALRTALWAISHMQDRRGYFYPVQTKHRTVYAPFHRWADGPMMVALAHCMSLPESYT